MRERIANILRKAATAAPPDVAIELLKEPAEVRLYDAMRAQRDVVGSATAQREYTAALGHLAQLRPAVDTFFDQVMVMAEDDKLRINRALLLKQLGSLMNQVADISKLAA